MEWSLSIHEMRRRAPLHYQVKAENARAAAYALSLMILQEEEEKAATKDQWRTSPKAFQALGYGGTLSVALYEAFQREACLALELIIKAVIAQRIESGVSQEHVVRVRPIHDLPSLWKDANLAALPREDQHRLVGAKSILNWAGRYAAPKTDQQFDREYEDLDKLEHREDVGGIKLIIPRTFNWDDVDRIYRVARSAFWETRGTR